MAQFRDAIQAHLLHLISKSGGSNLFVVASPEAVGLRRSRVVGDTTIRAADVHPDTLAYTQHTDG